MQNHSSLSGYIILQYKILIGTKWTNDLQIYPSQLTVTGKVLSLLCFTGRPTFGPSGELMNWYGHELEEPTLQLQGFQENMFLAHILYKYDWNESIVSS
jgi:hypothetical protein